MSRVIVFALFLLSGATALIYQVVWTKYLALIFGVTVLAVSTVLTCFFGGLALGSWLGGRWVDRRGEGFKWYGAAEAVIGAYAIVFPFLLKALNWAYALVAHSAGLGFTGLTLVKFCLSAIILLVPTTLMGATLPILSRTLARSERTFARDIGGLYTINTLGAVIGAVSATFVLIPGIGLKQILLGAGALNMLIGAFAVYLGKRAGLDAGPKGASTAEGLKSSQGEAGQDLEQKPLPGYFTAILVLAFAVSGFTGLAYEVVWTRTLGFILTGTVYAFTAVLAAFLSGIAAGSLVFSAFADRLRRASTLIFVLAAVEVLIGLSSIGLLSLYDALPSTALYKDLDSVPEWSRFIYLNFLTSFLTLLVPAFLFGATFPLVCKIYGGGSKGTGERIGNIYSVNTIGGIAGSFAGGFILIPLVGMQNTVVLVGAINVAAGAALMVFNPFSGKAARAGFLAGSALLFIIAVATLPESMPMTLHKSLLKKGERMVFYKEGAAATVMIAERPGSGVGSNKKLWINGNAATAAFYEALQINRFQGVVPMVLHPDPREVLVICFGSGTTFGTLSQFPVDRVDNVEIAPTVIEGAPNFAAENRDVLHNPRSHVNIDDGRSFLEATSRKFDVITEEPMHPALAGVVNLYTRDYYELAKARLKPGGIMSQWIPMYNVSVEEMRMMVKTFQSVFPHTTVWMVSSDIFMVGSPEATVIDHARIVEKLNMPNVKGLLTEIDLEDPAEFLSTFLMNEDMVRAYSAGAPVMTDDRPTVEFTGPRSLHVNTVSPNMVEFMRFREPVSPYLYFSGGTAGKEAGELLARLNVKYNAASYNLLGRAYLVNQDFGRANRYFRAALEVDPTDRNSLYYTKVYRGF